MLLCFGARGLLWAMGWSCSEVTLLVPKKRRPQEGKVAGAEMSQASAASPERTGAKGQGREGDAAPGTEAATVTWMLRHLGLGRASPGPAGADPALP